MDEKESNTIDAEYRMIPDLRPTTKTSSEVIPMNIVNSEAFVRRKSSKHKGMKKHKTTFKRHRSWVTGDPSDLLVGISEMFVASDLMQKIGYSANSNGEEKKSKKSE